MPTGNKYLPGGGSSSQPRRNRYLRPKPSRGDRHVSKPSRSPGVARRPRRAGPTRRTRPAATPHREAVKKLRNDPQFRKLLIHAARKYGTEVPATVRKTNPKLAKAAETARIKHIGEHEGLKEDPVAELAISTAATAGVGAGAKLAGLGGKTAVEAIGSKLASKEATAGAEAVEHGAKAIVSKAAKAASKKAAKRVERARTAPTRAASRVKAAPKRAKALPGDVKRAATTREGRRAAAKAAGRSAAHHPVRTGYGAAVALPPGVLPADATKRARAFAVGSLNAAIHHPGETAKTTGRSLAGAITGPAALLEAAGLSAIHRNPKYLTKTASEQIKGVEQIAGNAFSGDTKKAEQAARKEGSLAFLTPLPAVTRLKAYERARGRVRAGAADLRRNVAARSDQLNRRVRHAPEGVDQHVIGFAARHHARKTTALIKQRTDNPFRLARAHHREQVTKHIAKAPKGADTAFQTVAEYGIRDQRMAAVVRHKGPGDPHLVKALDYLDRHPELWRDPHFKNALKAAAANDKALPASLVGKGERARLLPQGDVFGITRPEHAVPHDARALTHATDRQGAWEDVAQLEKQAARLKKLSREKLVESRVLKGAPRSRRRAAALQANRDAEQLSSHAAALRKRLDAYTRPGQAIDRSQRMPYDKKLLAEYKQSVEAARKQAGAAPAIYTHHAEAPGHGNGLENPFPTPAGRVEHMREGRLAKEGKLDRSFEAYVRGTIDLPRMRESGRKFMRNFVGHFKTPFTIDGKQRFVGQGSKDWIAITSRRSAEHPHGGQFDPKGWGRLAYREFKNALSDPYITEAERQGKLESILADAEQGKVKGNEPWVLVPREAIKEARLQITPEKSAIVQALNAGGRVANRGILGTNPAWEIAQTVAEGIPILLAHPEAALKAPGILRDIHRYHKQNPEGALALEATAGAAPISSAALRQPLDMQETYTPALWEDGGKELTRGKSAKEALSFAKLQTLGRIDAKRQNAYRSVLYAMEADKRFRSFHTGVAGLFDRQRKLSGTFRGKSRQELWNWLENDPRGRKEKAKIEDYVDNVAGNWTAFTHFERTYAPLAIFYGFLRYSLRWTLWAFPKEHPVTATIAYTLGQANANQLEKLIGGKPSNPLEYAYPVYGTPVNPEQVKKLEGQGLSPKRAREIAGHAVLPGGSRISPGQSPLTQVLGTGDPAQVVSSANPFLGAAYTALSGKEPLSGEQSTLPRGYAAIKQLLAMPSPLRVTGGSQKILELLGAPGQSAASKAYGKFDPNRGVRSLALPMLPQSGDRFRESEGLSKAFEKKYGEGHVPGPFDSKLVQDLLYGGPGGTPKPKLLPKVLAKIHASEAASNAVKAAEEPFYGKSKPFSPLQKELLQAVEDAWQTGPNMDAASSGGRYSSGGKYASKNKYLSGGKYAAGNKYLGG